MKITIYNKMTFIIHNCRSAIRAFHAFLNFDKRELSSGSFCQKYSIQTSVFGYDNKNTPYKSKINPKWSYGDDACFITKNADSFVIGVADGVGGWRSYGINPSLFSRNFMKMCERTVEKGLVSPDNPLYLAKLAYYDVSHLKHETLGSATFCILSLCRNTGTLYSANLGDSGYLIIRNRQLVAKSINQKHSFNTPFQIALLPPSQRPQFHMDNPEEAYQNQFKMQPGDIVVVGTDGLFDNLPVSMIIHEVSLIQIDKRESLDACAQRLVDCAQICSITPDFLSPFACEARSHGIGVKGGNPGDITVILGQIIMESVQIESELERELFVTNVSR